MKITIETPKPGEEDEIIIKCKELDDSIMKLINGLKNGDDNILGYQEEKIVKLALKDIYYFESVDNKVFAYCGRDVYEVKKKLYELETLCGSGDFLRVSKSTIMNIAKLSYIKPIFNGRFEAKLKNDEKLIISRQYVVKLKEKLGL